ncbi:MAG: fumarylacetoacetate hydrolase family protein [Kofleriaceae bacterium]
MFSRGNETHVTARRGDEYVELGPDVGAVLALDHAALVKRAADAKPFDRTGAVYAPPIATGAKVLCLGLNFLDHAAEASFAKPEYPVIFSRFPQSFVGHDVALELPSVSDKFDYEAEVAVIIGKRGRHIAADAALSHVAGYSLLNDGSVRDWQMRTQQWQLGKNFDRSGAIGPEVVTADELPPGAAGLALTGRLNGTVMQHANTNDMVFDVATTIAYLSTAMALEVGDVIAMGTPAGIGNARKPPVFMKVGDTYEIELERVGTLRNTVAKEQR